MATAKICYTGPSAGVYIQGFGTRPSVGAFEDDPAYYFAMPREQAEGLQAAAPAHWALEPGDEPGDEPGEEAAQEAGDGIRATGGFVATGVIPLVSDTGPEIALLPDGTPIAPSPRPRR